ncbi:sugar kinase [Streptomyces halobius]
MVTFLPTTPGRLADVPAFERAIGGAESNVACMLAAAGHRARWLSRVGADSFGDHLVQAITGYGVDTRAVRRDPTRPTGIYFRTAGDRVTDAHEVAYYRAGSAASAMSVTTMDLAAIGSGRILHLSGITAALSEDCLGLLGDLTTPRPGRPLVSFDVNHRAGLWTGDRDPRILLDLARRADIVFVGDDEARDAWGLHGIRALREAIPEPDILVVKQGRGGAMAFHDVFQGVDDPLLHRTGITELRTRVPSLNVDVIAAAGAGDAFAAGFLSATLRGLPVRTRIRYGHLWAAAALTAPGDLAAPPGRALADRLAGLDDTAWGTLHLGPGWTNAMAADEQADEEVRTR